MVRVLIELKENTRITERERIRQERWRMYELIGAQIFKEMKLHVDKKPLAETYYTKRKKKKKTIKYQICSVFPSRDSMESAYRDSSSKCVIERAQKITCV